MTQIKYDENWDTLYFNPTGILRSFDDSDYDMWGSDIEQAVVNYLNKQLMDKLPFSVYLNAPVWDRNLGYFARISIVGYDEWRDSSILRGAMGASENYTKMLENVTDAYGAMIQKLIYKDAVSKLMHIASLLDNASIMCIEVDGDCNVTFEIYGYCMDLIFPYDVSNFPVNQCVSVSEYKVSVDSSDCDIESIQESLRDKAYITLAKDSIRCKINYLVREQANLDYEENKISFVDPHNPTQRIVIWECQSNTTWEDLLKNYDSITSEYLDELFDKNGLNYVHNVTSRVIELSSGYKPKLGFSVSTFNGYPISWDGTVNNITFCSNNNW